jgi:hypothetical protein
MEEDPELVRDAGANYKSTEFHPNERNVTVTTHWIEEGLLSYTGERWVRKENIGDGGQGTVFLECLQDDESKERAVKRIKIADEDVKRRYYVRELETLMKFSQDGVSRWRDSRRSRLWLTVGAVQEMVRSRLWLVRNRALSLHPHGVFSSGRSEEIHPKAWPPARGRSKADYLANSPRVANHAQGEVCPSRHQGRCKIRYHIDEIV